MMELEEPVDPKPLYYYGPGPEEFFPPLFLKFHHVLITLVLYVLAVTVVGPRLMSGRKPFNLRKIIMAYNLAQVFVNAVILAMAVYHYPFMGQVAWDHACHPIGETIGFTVENKTALTKMLYYFYITKIVDLMDTVFFVLRKKQSQVTFLHVFHHSSMVFNMWFSVVHLREEVISIFGFLNTTIHIIMYAYYFLSAFGPSMQKYLWWKKYITILQLAQFVAMIAICAKIKLTDCGCHPVFWSLWTGTVTAYFFLFLHFYVKSYRSHPKKE